MGNIILTLVRPSFLGKIKPYQNLSLIIWGVSLLLIFMLALFNHVFLSKISDHAMLLTVFFFVVFVILSLTFLLQKTEILTIKDWDGFIEIDKKLIAFDIKKVRFLLNIDIKRWQNQELLKSGLINDLSFWGNYMIIPSENLSKNIYIQFLPDEDFLSMGSELTVEVYKRKFSLMMDTSDMFKSFMRMFWGAS